MRTLFLLAAFAFVICTSDTQAQQTLDSLPVRAFAIASPSPSNVDSFIVFINKELAPHKINTLILRIDYNYQYKSHPELAEASALSLAQVKKLVNACKQNNIDIIPQINLLGHQSWAGKISMLLKVYPQFDETPWVKIPAKYVWPNADSLYCKSYCPLHPGVHAIVFDMVDEICTAFEAKAFHAGMDEVFYIGMDKCPRCAGKDKAQLFAGEVKKIRDHLAKSGKTLWIWGDRLIDGWVTGIGGWEASYNNTAPAIDLVPKDIVICDWHYERPDKTPAYFAIKGLKVINCSWNSPDVAALHLTDMYMYRATATPEMKDRYLGVMQTVWSGVTDFLNEYYKRPAPSGKRGSQWQNFDALFAIKK